MVLDRDASGLDERIETASAFLGVASAS